jgi:hypothetical protein
VYFLAGGDTVDEWRNIAGYEGLYQVSRCGLVRSLRRHKLMAVVHNQAGYRQVNLYRESKVKNFLVHRLVAAAFLGPIPKGMQVNHKDGDKENNSVDNLEFMTPEENREHAIRTGLTPCSKGEANVRAKLKEAQVREMRSLRQAKVKLADLASRFGITVRMVCEIVSRRAWKHVA